MVSKNWRGGRQRKQRTGATHGGQLGGVFTQTRWMPKAGSARRRQQPPIRERSTAEEFSAACTPRPSSPRRRRGRCRCGAVQAPGDPRPSRRLAMNSSASRGAVVQVVPRAQRVPRPARHHAEPARRRAPRGQCLAICSRAYYARHHRPCGPRGPARYRAAAGTVERHPPRRISR